MMKAFTFGSLGLKQFSRIGAPLGGVLPPAGFVWLVGADGQYLFGADGQQLYGRAS